MGWATLEKAALDRVLHRKLYPGCLGLALLYLLLTVAHLLLLEGMNRVLLTAVAATSSGLGLLGAGLLRRGYLGERVAHPVGFAVCMVILGNSLLHLALTGDLHQTTNIMLSVIVGGALLLTLRWWAVMAAMAVGGWLACLTMLRTGHGEEVHFGIALLMAVFVSGLMTRVLRDLTVETEIRFRELSASIREVFWIAEPGLRRILYVSPAYAAIWGQAPERALNDASNHLERVHPEDLPAVRKAVEQQAAGLETHVEFRVVGVDGAIRWLQDRAYPVRDARGELLRVNGLTCDITEVRLAAQERERMERHLGETQRMESLALLAGGVAHDFNNLLMVILGNANLARQGSSADSTLDKRLAQIERTAVRAGELCRQMLAYSGQGRIECQVFLINDAVREMADLLEASISRRATLDFRLAPLLPPILADPTQIQQILLNLVVNASEALGDRSGLIEVSTSLHHAQVPFRSEASGTAEHPAGEYVALSVADTGHGMEPEVARRVFEPFFSTKFAGRGLGLAAVLGIVRGHSGAIRVESIPGSGTTFRVLFPVSEQAVPQASREAMPVVPPWTGQGRVLVVDDQDFIRQLLITHLVHLGFETEAAKDGEEALASLKQATPGWYRAVLLDWSMPGLEGPEILRQIGALDVGAAIVLMTGYDSHQLLETMAGPRPAGVLQKPFTPQTLRQVLRDALGGK
ncbi:MAG: response regulator [Verrucomicrobiales bacterium]|nr:response regulator [Verrucomicrobiales bacterium]